MKIIKDYINEIENINNCINSVRVLGGFLNDDNIKDLYVKWLKDKIKEGKLPLDDYTNPRAIYDIQILPGILYGYKKILENIEVKNDYEDNNND